MVGAFIERASDRSILGFGLAVLLLSVGAPVLHAEGAVPLSLIYGTSETTAESTVAIEITQEELEKYDGPTISTMRDVHTQAQLVEYAASLMLEDSDIQRITLGTDEVSMTYRSKVEVLRFGERTLTRTVRVSSSGVVTVEQPWYANFTTSEKDHASGFSDVALTSDDAGLSARTEARLLMRMQGRFQIGAI